MVLLLLLLVFYDCVKRPSSSLCRLRRFKIVRFTLHYTTLHYITVIKEYFHYGCAALRCALRTIVNDRERCVAMSRYISSATSLHIVHYSRSLSLTIGRNAQRSAAVVETGL